MNENKTTNKKLPWTRILFGLVIIALVILFMTYNYYNKDTKDDEDTATLISVKENNSTVADFVKFVQNDTSKMGLDHAYTHQAILKLIQAVDAMAGEIDYDVHADLGKAKELAATITRNPYTDAHADSIKIAADIMTSALQNMQQAKYPQLTGEVQELRNASGSINPELLTLNQKDAVKAYFRKAADLLSKMN